MNPFRRIPARAASLAVATALVLGACASRTPIRPDPYEPHGPYHTAETLEAWRAVLEYYRADSSSLGTEESEASLPLIYWDSGQADGLRVPVRWRARLLADSLVDGFCGYYLSFLCLEHRRARHLSLAGPRPSGDSLLVDVDLVAEVRALCGTKEWNRTQHIWGARAVLVRRAGELVTVKDTVLYRGDEAVCTAEPPDPQAVPLPPDFAEPILLSALRGIEWWLNLPAPFCLSFEDGDNQREPPPALLRRLELKHRVLTRKDCPPTYGSMIRTVDSLGRDIVPKRPAGYIDPYHIRITPPVALTTKQAVVRLQASQGTRGWLFHCDVAMAPPTTATCGPTTEWIN